MVLSGRVISLLKRKLVPLILPVIFLVTSCTPREVELWKDWHAKDPVAANNFAHHLSPLPTYNSRWDSIAWCESGGNWHYPPVTNGTGTYSGGLMIWQKAWISYGGRQFASWAYLASKSQQIKVAERIRAQYGWSAWDCA